MDVGERFNRRGRAARYPLWLPDDLVASECIDGWDLNPRSPDQADEDYLSRMDKNDYTAADPARAFARLRTIIFVARNWSMAA